MCQLQPRRPAQATTRKHAHWTNTTHDVDVHDDDDATFTFNSTYFPNLQINIYRFAIHLHSFTAPVPFPLQLHLRDDIRLPSSSSSPFYFSPLRTRDGERGNLKQTGEEEEEEGEINPAAIGGLFLAVLPIELSILASSAIKNRPFVIQPTTIRRRRKRQRKKKKRTPVTKRRAEQKVIFKCHTTVTLCEVRAHNDILLVYSNACPNRIGPFASLKATRGL